MRIAPGGKSRARELRGLAALFGVAALATGCNATHIASPKPPKLHRTVVAAARAPASPVGTTKAATISGNVPRSPESGRPQNIVVSIPLGPTVVATMHGNVPGSPEPGTSQNMVVPATWYGYPSILPVIDSTSNWVEVRLAQRPDGSTTWVPLNDVTLSTTPYLLILDLASKHLMVYENGQQIMDFPAGVGSPDDPTVTGSYFVTMRVPAPDPGYGPFVLVTSAHSDSIADWAGSGDAIIAIHGPITAYDDQLIGSTGAAISHGCIRLHDADLAQLAGIPAGTPLDIVSGVA